MDEPDNLPCMEVATFDIEARPSGIKFQFVDEKGNPVRVSLAPDLFKRFRQEAQGVANQLVRDGDRPNWASRAAAYKPPSKSPRG